MSTLRSVTRYRALYRWTNETTDYSVVAAIHLSVSNTTTWIFKSDQTATESSHRDF